MKKINCSNCQSTFGEYESNCPFCGKENEQFPLGRKFLRLDFLHIAKHIGLMLCVVVGFSIIGVIVSLIYLFAIPDESLQNTLINFTAYLILFVGTIGILNVDIKRIAKRFAKVRPLIAGVIGCAAMILFSFLYNLILQLAGVSYTDNDNQKAIVQMVSMYPALTFFTTVIFAPITEELGYRLGLFNSIRMKKRFLAYIVTVLVFAFAHFNFAVSTLEQLINELTNLPVYLFSAFVLCYLNENEGIAASMYAHMLNNLISFIMIIAQK